MGTNIWFTSDHHFGHVNILEFESEVRPFKNITDMNEALVERWNGVVGVQDTVYHLGDFCFGRNNIHIAARLQGKKRLVLGNHDTYSINDYLQYFERIYGVKYLDKLVLSHMPIHQHGLGRRWWVNVHGHLHSKKVQKKNPWYQNFEEDRNYFNVSVEQHNLTPVHIDVIRERVKEVEDA